MHGATTRHFFLDTKQSEVYCPLSGDPKMPIASSAQMRRSIIRRTTQMAIRSLVFFIFRITSSHIKPVPSSKTAAAIKSNSVQFTSSVNCIAINGMSNRTATADTMMISLLFCIIINVLFSLRLGWCFLGSTCQGGATTRHSFFILLLTLTEAKVSELREEATRHLFLLRTLTEAKGILTCISGRFISP